MSDRRITAYRPGERSMSELARSVRMLESGSNRGPGSSFGLPFRLANWQFQLDGSGRLIATNLTSGLDAMVGLGLDASLNPLGYVRGNGAGGFTVAATVPQTDIAFTGAQAGTATIRQNAVAIATVNTLCAWIKLGPLAFVSMILSANANAPGGGEIDVTFSGIPAPADGSLQACGQGKWVDITGPTETECNVYIHSTRFRFKRTDITSTSYVGNAPAFTLATGDNSRFSAVYWCA